MRGQERFLERRNIRKMKKTPRCYLIQCRKCGNKMKYMTYSEIFELSKKIKRCVYCGFNNRVDKAIIRDDCKI